MKKLLLILLLLTTYVSAQVDRYTETYLKIALGKQIGMSYVQKFGENEAIGTASLEDIWGGGGTYTFLTTASYLEAVSSSVLDSNSAVGVHNIIVHGLDANFNEIVDTLIMGGTSVIDTSRVPFIRVNRAYAYQVGQYAVSGADTVNVGNISIRVLGGGATVGYIAAGYGQTQQAIYTVPNGYTAYLTDVNIHAETAKSIDFYMWKRENANVTDTLFSPKRIIDEYVGVANSLVTAIDYVRLPAKTDVWLSGKANTTAGKATAHYTLLLVED